MALRLTTMASHEINTLHYERNARLPSNKIQFRAVNSRRREGRSRGGAIGINTTSTLLEKFLQFDWLRAVVFQHNLKYLHVKITNLLRVVV